MSLDKIYNLTKIVVICVYFMMSN